MKTSQQYSQSSKRQLSESGGRRRDASNSSQLSSFIGKTQERSSLERIHTFSLKESKEDDSESRLHSHREPTESETSLIRDEGGD